ncbi:MAG: lytic transglycosylase domain-containing protein [Flavobacteriales bacterium]|nr:lytic transglycosylase domain-containing protein [Flavobacteriales bacterium]
MKAYNRTILQGVSLAALVLLATVAVQVLISSTSNEGTDLDHQRQFNDSYKVFSLTLPSEITFCGEPVPMDKLDVRERLDRELLVNTYWQSNSLLALKRATRWFPMIEEVLRENGVPDDMKFIALIESGLTNTVSPKGATGYWQFMKETALQYGMEVNGEVDERYHVRRSTEAACRYLKEAHAKYGSWALAAASYNLGPGGLDRQLERQQVGNYFDLLLPEETSRYVFRVLAMKEILRDPARYGFHLREQDRYAPYRTRTVSVTGPVTDITAFATRQGTDYKTVKLLNPWLRDAKLTNKEGRNYTLLLPAEGFDQDPSKEDR